MPVAVRLARKRSPEMFWSPWTERVRPGVVVPMPNLPSPSIRMTSVRSPDWRIEKVKEEEAVK